MPDYLSLLIMIPLVLETIGLTFAIVEDMYLSSYQRRVLLSIVALVAVLIAQNLVAYLFEEMKADPVIITAAAVLGYTIRPVIILLFFSLISRRGDYKPEIGLLVLNALVHLTAFFSGICFSIDDAGIFHRGPLGFTCHIVSAILLAELVVVTVRRYREQRRYGFIVPAFTTLMIILSVLADSYLDYRLMPMSFLTIAIVNGSLFYYLWLHLRTVEQHEKAVEADQRIKIMMSQIQPHFLFNTLSTIQALCMVDPDKAAEVTEKFGRYLRDNIDSLDQAELLPLSRALEHTKVYAEIEQVRFPDIKVIYEIEDYDIMLPALTIQPMVENAIKHGIRGMNGGRVVISTRKVGDDHVITIRDNGKGFDVEKMEEQEKNDELRGAHIGIKNVRDRIERMCKGTVEIESAIGEGTTVTIKIPEAAGQRELEG